MYGKTTRRHFMQASAGAALAAWTGTETRLAAGPKIEPRADAVILLWMAGGMAQTETFDPKKFTPYETGMASEKVLSTFTAPSWLASTPAS